MSNKCVFFKEKEQKSIDGGITWVDTGRFRKGALVSTQAAQCGSFVTEYRWTKADYVCDNANKYKGYKQQVSHDNGGSWVDTGVVDIGELISSNSKDCGYDEKWFTLTGEKDFICDGAAKYKKKEMKYTRDSGTTWNSFDTPKYGKGDLIEETSTDCASMKVTYTDGTTKYFTKLKTIEKDTVPNKANVKDVEIYDDVTVIGEEAFQNCPNLRTMRVNATTPPALGYGPIPSTIQRIYVPADSVDKYKTADGWKDFVDKIYPIGYDEQWFTLTGEKDFICSEGSKYKKKELKYTKDSGTTWNSFDTPKYGKGDLIDSNPSDCAGMKVTYTDGTTKYFTKLKTIEKDTVSNKEKAKEVEIYDDVTGIGEEAFSGCTSLTSITIPNSIISIGEEAFKDCEKLTGVTIPDSVTSIGNGAFIYCASLTSITIPNSITSIGRSTFYGCEKLTGVTIPDSVKTIDYGAFMYCKSLFTITIPNSVTSIGENAFYQCSSLTGVTLSDSLISIDYTTFGYCIRLISIIIPDSVKTIGADAFLRCSHLESVTIGNGVTSIEHHAFDDCSNLATMTVKATTSPNVGDGAIPGSIQTIYVPAESVDAYKAATNWSAYADRIYPIGSAIPAMKVTYVDGTEKTFINLKKIDQYTDKNKSNAETVEIYDSVTSIDSGAFSNSYNLTSITISNSVTSIGYSAFGNCTELISIIIPTGVTSIAGYAFDDCSSLRTMTVNATTPPTLGKDAIPTTISRIYVPADSVAAYKSADDWKDFVDKIKAIP